MVKSLSEEFAKPIPGNPLGSYISFPEEIFHPENYIQNRNLRLGEKPIPRNISGSTYFSFPYEIFNQKP